MRMQPPASPPLGFHVWNPNGHLPTFTHQSFLGAWAEKDRLTRANPRDRFVVMAPVEDMSMIGYSLGWTEGREEGLAQAHREIMKAEAHTDRLCDEVHDLRKLVKRLQVIIDRAAPFQAIVADCLLWFDGFNAHFAGKAARKRPNVPDREGLRKLNEALQGLLPDGLKPDLDDHIPF